MSSALVRAFASSASILATNSDISTVFQSSILFMYQRDASAMCASSCATLRVSGAGRKSYLFSGMSSAI